MNVQTLPPGYKTAPWTPPDRITGAMLAEASSKLIDLLRIRTQPIGMRLFEDPKDMEAIKGLRKPTDGFKFTSSLPAQLLKGLAPAIRPLLDEPGLRTADAKTADGA